MDSAHLYANTHALSIPLDTKGTRPTMRPSLHATVQTYLPPPLSKDPTQASEETSLTLFSLKETVPPVQI